MLSLILAQAEVCDPGDPVGDCAHTIEGLGPIFLNILSALLPIGGIVLFVMLVLGGFSFITSSGDPRKAEGAKATITYAILGIVVLACAFLIVQIIANFAGVPAILDFQVYIP